MQNIDVVLVRRLVAAQFPKWVELPIKPVEFSGWDNRTFHLGEHMSARFPSAACYVPQMEKEALWLPKLAPHLPLPIPEPLALGKPGEGFPWPWSIYRWLPGQMSSENNIEDLNAFATALGQFLAVLQRIDAAEGPKAGAHNFYRGGDLVTYNGETEQAIRLLKGEIDTVAVEAVWAEALASKWKGPPVWVHGDIAVENLLVQKSQLSAVIDFGCLGAGDPACDLVMAWTFFKGQSRKAFQAALPLDRDTWSRGRGWALWKALVVCAKMPGTNPRWIEKSQRIIEALLADL